ncbi:MAG: GNAT family N-acetyltransferase [Firmicutes bacterium]|nr:GNAT family N-acetyltransferase [Bacillota bacterium]
MKKCDLSDLPRCVDIAFRRNNTPESSCAFCPRSKAAIESDFRALLPDPDCLLAGCFDGGTRIGVLGCFMNPENGWVDLIGPFLDGDWDGARAIKLVRFAMDTLPKAKQFNFYFDARNENAHRLAEVLNAERKDNEYIMVLSRADYVPQRTGRTVVSYTAQYGTELAGLHDKTFPDIYVSGAEILSTVGETREAFCALDEDGAFAGYGVLALEGGGRALCAEIFAVKEEFRGQGFGWALLNAVCAAAFRDHRGDTVILVVDKLNAGARALYESCGFRLKTENEACRVRV